MAIQEYYRLRSEKMVLEKIKTKTGTNQQTVLRKNPDPKLEPDLLATTLEAVEKLETPSDVMDVVGQNLLS